MKKILFIMLILMTTLVSATYSLTNLTLQGDVGESVHGTVFLSGLTTDSIITLESTNLVSGSNTLTNSNIIIIEKVDSPNSIDIRQYDITVNIPSTQPVGNYIGTLKAYEAGKLVAQSTLTIDVESNVTPGAAFTIDELSLGSDNQAREKTASGNIRITNTGSETLTISLTNNVQSQYQFTITQSSVTLTSGQTTDIPVTVYVPDTEDSGRHTIGTLTGTASGLTTTSTIYLETKSELEISKVKIEVDGDSESVSDNEKIDANAGDDILLTITVKNNFDDNIDINDVQVTVESDSDLDWDDDNDVGDISDGDKEEIDFSFSIDNEIDEDEYDVDITVDGEDDNGAIHKDTFSFIVNVDRKSHEVTIKSATISPNRVSCDTRTITVRTNIENTGSNNEDDISIVLENKELDIYEYATGIELDKGDDTDNSFVFTLPKNTKTGEYLIDVTTQYDNKKSDLNVLSLLVEQCTGTINTTTTTTGNNQNNGGEGSGTIQPIVYPSGTTEPTYGGISFFNSTAYVILLVVAVLIFIILIIVLLIKFVF